MTMLECVKVVLEKVQSHLIPFGPHEVIFLLKHSNFSELGSSKIKGMYC